MRISTTALALLAFALPAQAQTAIRWVPEAGSHGYRYEAVSHVPGAPGTSTRLDYDLVSDGKGGLVVVVKAAWHRNRDAGEWSNSEIDDACRTALHAQGGELARVTLSPIAPGMANLGTALMADCARPEIFFPVADILKFSALQVAPQFGLAELARPGDSRRFAGEKVHIDRADTLADVESPGGTLTLVALVPGRATVEMVSDSQKVRSVHRKAYNGADVTLTGTESAAFRIEIDPATGVLLGATTMRDLLDMTMSLPGDYSQPLPITREIRIVPLP